MMSSWVGVFTYNNINTLWWIPEVDFRDHSPLTIQLMYPLNQRIFKSLLLPSWVAEGDITASGRSVW